MVLPEVYRDRLATAATEMFAIAQYIQKVELSSPGRVKDEEVIIEHFVRFLRKLQNLQFFRYRFLLPYYCYFIN